MMNQPYQGIYTQLPKSDNMSTEFKWTDELVEQLIWDEYGSPDVRRKVADFKASHSVSEGGESRREFLFTTEDGVDVFEGDSVFLLTTERWLISRCAAPRNPFKGNKIQFKYFSTEEAATDYINMNKPVLCVLDIHTILLCLSHVNDRDINKYDYNDQIKKSVFTAAQSKIKGDTDK